jgi:thiamine biosynthesis lipoprotein
MAISERPLVANDRRVFSAVYMDTVITIEVVQAQPDGACYERVSRAFGWFDHVEQRCSRFAESSELSALIRAEPGAPVSVSPLLFQLIEFALAVAQASGGAFDPTVGQALAARGYNRNYRADQETTHRPHATRDASYRDVVLSREHGTVTLLKPLVLDLGAVAKGFAIDLAAAELSCFPGYAINAGGDVLVRGRNSAGAPWRIGIKNPRQPAELIETLVVSDGAVCTSGDYERPRPDGQPGHHIIQPQTGESPWDVASVTVVAATAMVADALSTAVFVLGRERGLQLLEGQGVDGLIISPRLELCATGGLSRYRR